MFRHLSCHPYFMRRFTVWAILMASAAPAQAPAPLKLGTVTVQGSVRSRLEAWNWFEPDSGDPSYAFLGMLARLGFSRNHKTLDWQIEFAAPILLGLPDNATAPGSQGELGLGATYFNANKRNRNAAMIFPKQVFMRFKGLMGDPRHNLRLGRFDFADGSELAPKNATLATIKRDRITMRLIGPFNFTHVFRGFDGFHWTYDEPGANFTFVGAVPTRGVFQVDGWGWNKVAFAYGAYTKSWGRGRHAVDTRVFGMLYDDWRPINKTDNRSLIRRTDTGEIRTMTFGAHSLHAFETSSGVADLLLWGAVQAGRWGSLDHRAHAFAIEAGFQPKIAPKLKPWFRGGFYDGSGDKDPADSKHGTFFQMLPTPRFFARFPFFNMMNNRDINGFVILRPHAKLTLSSEFHALSLSNRNDLWYLGGGAFQPRAFGFAGRNAGGRGPLANLWDTNAEIRLRPNITVNAFIGYAQARAAAKFVYPRSTHGALGLLEWNYRF